MTSLPLGKTCKQVLPSLNREVVNFELCIALFPLCGIQIQRLLTAPAAGHRTETEGTLLDAGKFGRCWSSSPLASDHYNAGYLRFWAEEVTPLYNMKRANALSVRCVQASACEAAFRFLHPNENRHRPGRENHVYRPPNAAVRKSVATPLLAIHEKPRRHIAGEGTRGQTRKNY